MTQKELYTEFLKNFPNFEPMVRKTAYVDEESLQVFTKQGKSFIFRMHNDEIKLESVK